MGGTPPTASMCHSGRCCHNPLEGGVHGRGLGTKLDLQILERLFFIAHGPGCAGADGGSAGRTDPRAKLLEVLCPRTASVRTSRSRPAAVTPSLGARPSPRWA